jgi:hypothetical protein
MELQIYLNLGFQSMNQTALDSVRTDQSAKIESGLELRGQNRNARQWPVSSQVISQMGIIPGVGRTAISFKAMATIERNRRVSVRLDGRVIVPRVITVQNLDGHRIMKM